MDSVFSSTMRMAAAIRAGHISAAEVLEAHVARIDTYNPGLNAIVTMDASWARERARQADEALARGEVWGPLHGVPFTLKDAHATAGMRTTGFPPLDHVPREDSAVTARLRAAGGILLGKTNVTMLLGDCQSHNPIFGRTNNPWNLDRTPGGSSGGAAAAVASGMTPFDMGTDLSALIRIPAHFCGLFGLKPTEKRVSLLGLFPGLSTPRSIRIMSTIGPMARTAEDLALLYSIIAGPDGYDTEVLPHVGARELPAAFNLLVGLFVPAFYLEGADFEQDRPTGPGLGRGVGLRTPHGPIRRLILWAGSRVEIAEQDVPEASSPEIDVGDHLEPDECNRP